MNAIRQLINHFEDMIELHVEPDDVRKWIIEHGFCDEVTFYYVDTDPKLFNGLFIERHLIGTKATGVYSEPLICREIFICKNAPDDERRLTEVKELLHILDRKEEHTSKYGQIEALIEYAATHLELPNEDGGISDAFAEYRALAILFPWEVRNLLKPAYDAKKISSDEIADLAKVPEIYIRLAMSERWEAAYEGLLGPKDEA